MNDTEYMDIAILEAKKAFEENEVPVGAIIVKDGEIIAKSHNKRENNIDISSHAEIEAMKEAAKKIGRWTLEGCTMYVTLEPCLMCSGAILQSRLSRLVIGAKEPETGAVVSGYYVFDDPKGKNRPLINVGVKEGECAAILAEFFKSKREHY